jgi:putative methionine-R-sulfoxide reductase with GAF domain
MDSFVQLRSPYIWRKRTRDALIGQWQDNTHIKQCVRVPRHCRTQTGTYQARPKLLPSWTKSTFLPILSGRATQLGKPHRTLGLMTALSSHFIDYSEMTESSNSLADGLRVIAAIANRGHVEQLWRQIEIYLTEALNAKRGVVLLRTAGVWQPWDFATASSLDGLPDEAANWKHVREFKGHLCVPIVPGAVCAIVFDCNPNEELLKILEIVATSLGAMATTCERQTVAAQNLDDVQALQKVATRILKSHDLSEIMQLITLEAKRLLSADICGLLLREGDEIVMQRCVGHSSVATASLRMRQGQGIAGQVFASMQPCRVEDYLQSDEISRDFFSLAKDERVRSALAAPLLSRDDVIGVLEVWRRRPSTFTDLETSRLVALANLVSIAIENARLYTAGQSSLHELEQANRTLNDRYDIVRSLVVLTQDLVQFLLVEEGLPAIAKRASEYLDASVLITNHELHVIASSPLETELPLYVITALRAARDNANASDERTPSHIINPESDRRGAPDCLTQGIFVGKELVGFVIVFPSGAIDDAFSLAVGQVVLATALYSLEQRSVSRARSETLDAIVWDLLEGTDVVRSAAIDRLREIKIAVPPSLRVLLCAFEPLGKYAQAPALGFAALEERRQAVRSACALSASVSLRQGILSARAGVIAILFGDDGSRDIEPAISILTRRIASRLPDNTVLLGVGSRIENVRVLPKAYREARISVDVARQRGRSGAVVYDKSGVVGLLFSVKQDAGIQGLIDSTFGRLMKEDLKNRQQLIDTLRIYFDVNCSQEAAAQRLGVHRKTVSYRLSKISELTGLDFKTHEDRLMADLALYIQATISQPEVAWVVRTEIFLG